MFEYALGWTSTKSTFYFKNTHKYARTRSHKHQVIYLFFSRQIYTIRIYTGNKYSKLNDIMCLLEKNSTRSISPSIRKQFLFFFSQKYAATDIAGSAVTGARISLECRLRSNAFAFATGHKRQYNFRCAFYFIYYGIYLFVLLWLFRFRLPIGQFDEFVAAISIASVSVM